MVLNNGTIFKLIDDIILHIIDPHWCSSPVEVELSVHELSSADPGPFILKDDEYFESIKSSDV
jgi:hypothetical protein